MSSFLYCIWHRGMLGLKRWLRGCLSDQGGCSAGWSKHWAEVAGPRHCGPTGVYALLMVQQLPESRVPRGSGCSRGSEPLASQSISLNS